MGVASDLAVRFTADTSGLEAGGQKAEGLIGRMTSGLGKLGLAGMGIGVIKDAIGGVVGSFGELISAAEGADDAVARLNVVLGSDAADKLTKAAEANANALGLSKTAFLETAGAAANYLTNLGIGKDAAADMSAGLTELAPKLAAFANVPVEQAMGALQKGVGGATRGLKEMGIAISEEDIKAKALELGLQKVSTTHTVAAGAADKLKLAQEKLTATVAKYGEGSAKANLAHVAFAKAQEAAAGKTASVVAPLTEAAKAQALYALIQEQSAGANAAWADNQGDVANSMARVKAAMEDAKVAIGEKLLPVIAPLAQMFADALPGAIEKVTGALTPLLNGLGDVAQILFGSFGPEMKAARDNLGPFATVLGDLRSVAIAVADVIRGDFSSAFDNIGEILPDIGIHFSGIYDLGTKVQGMFDAAGGYAGIFSSALDALTVALATAWANVQPLIDVVAAAGAKFVEFAGGPGHLMQTVIGTALVVAFLALAAAAASAAAGIIAALAPILIPIGLIVAAVVVLRKAWDTNFGGIQEKTAAVVDWIQANVGPAIATMVSVVQSVLGSLAAWWKENGDYIVNTVRGMWDVIAGVFSAAFAYIKGLVSVFLAVFRGDFEGAGKALIAMWQGVGEGLGRALKGALSVIVNVLAGILEGVVTAAIGIGKAIISGVLAGLKAAPTAISDFLIGMAKGALAAVKKTWGIASPAKAFEGLSEMAVAGLKAGFVGLSELAGIVNETLGRIIGDADRENFKSIAELTSSLLDIFTNTTQAIKALLQFDVTTSAEQISAQFDALVGTFQTALLRMKGLAQYAGRGDSPLDFLNMFDVQNIETVSKGFEATISLIDGVLDIAAKLQTVKVPSASDIAALFEPLTMLGDVAARFIKKVGTPEGEDATAHFEQGATTTAALASWAKAVADIVGLKFDAVAADFSAQMTAAAAAAQQAWDAVSATATAWGAMGVTVRDQMLTGIQSYAAAVGAAVGLLKATAELKIDAATLATAELMRKAADASATAVGLVAVLADWWIRAGDKVTGPIVAGMKAFADGVGAAVSVLGAAGGLALDKMVAATRDQLHTAADVSAMALGELLRVIGQFTDMAAEARTALVVAVKDYADAAGAAVSLLSSAGAMDFTDAVDVTRGQLSDAADASAMALSELLRVVGTFADMAAKARTELVQAVKDFADAAGSAVDLLVKGAAGMNALGEIKRLAGIQPRLIRQILEQLRNVVAIVTDPKNAIKPPSDEQIAALKTLGETSGVFDGIVKAAAGMNELGAVKRLSGVQPRLIRQILSQLSTVVGIVTDPKTALKPVTSEQTAAIKAIGDSSGVLSALAGVADGFAKMSGKLTIPTDLSARVTALIDAMRTVVAGITGAMTGDGAISLKDAVAGADIAEAVGRIGDSMAPIFDAINAAIESPFGRIKATGQRGDTFRQNIANRVKASLVAAVTAISEALASMPTIDVPDALVTQVDKLASVYERILDVVERLGEVKIDTRAVSALAAALGVLAGGTGALGGGAGGISVTGGGSQLTIASGPGGGIVINNAFNPTLTPMPVTINTTNNISVGNKVVESIASEVKHLQELELRQGGTP